MVSWRCVFWPLAAIGMTLALVAEVLRRSNLAREAAFQQLLAHCFEAKFFQDTVFHVMGERHSGTTVLAWELRTRLCSWAETDSQRPMLGLPAWKHDLVEEPKASAQRLWQNPGAHHVVVIISRNPYTWLAAMWQEPWNTRFAHEGWWNSLRSWPPMLSLEDFVSVPWSGASVEVPSRNYSFANILAMRTAKLKALLALNVTSAVLGSQGEAEHEHRLRSWGNADRAGEGIRVAVVDYDTFADAPEQEVLRLADAVGALRPPETTSARRPATPKLSGSRVSSPFLLLGHIAAFDRRASEAKYAAAKSMMTGSLLQAINEHLDCNLERSLGYRLCDDTVLDCRTSPPRCSESL
eukprot:TRINITY_DN87250_c0_g1_i1.p1 TRINITY_DN87250_c0_g1~~TRINITY_DN87250_c0_g1_i1.p1  ORF type:complete len:352 (+),score=69.05 TRINITY_DN87250_c0_g1_i1:49-1104(+)